MTAENKEAEQRKRKKKRTQSILLWVRLTLLVLQAAQEDELAGEGGGDAQGDAACKLGGVHVQNIAGVIKGYFVIPA